MTRRSITISLSVAVALVAAAIGCVCTAHENGSEPADTIAADTDSIGRPDWEGGNAAMPEGDEAVRYTSLTEEDFVIVAKELDVEVAAIKAVVRIEAGVKMEGFWAPGVPIINPDKSLYKAYAHKAVNRAGNKNAKVPAGLTGFPLRRWTTLTNWRKNNAEGADMGTLWGMFQIGGFAYKTCGCATIQEFVTLMSRSEFDQLELFAAFVLNTGYVKYIRTKDWAAFARRYNGPSYAKRGYHTRMAKEYAKFKQQSK